MPTESEFVATIKSKLPTTASASTADSYVRFVKNVKTKYDEKPLTSFAWLKSTNAVVETIEKNYAVSTRTSIYNAIHMCLKTGTKPYKTLAAFYQDKMREGMSARKTTEGEKTEKQDAYWTSWDDIIKRRDELKGINKVILSLYTMIPPGRALEYATMEVNGTGNSYEDGKFIIRKHKTSKDTGVVTVDVPKDLRKVLDAWLDGRTSGSLLGLSAPSITKHLNSIFKPKKIGVSALRHLYLAKYSGVKAEMMADSAAMRHSVGTALGTYVKT